MRGADLAERNTGITRQCRGPAPGWSGGYRVQILVTQGFYVGRTKRLNLLGRAGVREPVEEIVDRVLVVDVNPRLGRPAVSDVHNDDDGSPRMRLARALVVAVKSCTA